ncbi:MAG TPA: bacteriohopanetetrol glucosamine biosynthesis glycosyltransferase HpnI [Rhizomicrobium sp.]|jgi:ceramide glucosyltransferase|nr:bacteriohopanetetrol glucosamine biosynthesis glycosyltransferase HpnI [Rhizomicrobium sp.]
MLQLGDLTGLTFCFLAVIAMGFTLAAALAVAPGPVSITRERRRSRAPVTLLKPLHLAEPGLEENLRTFLRQDYEGPVQIVFGAKSYYDPALRIVAKLQRAYPAADIKVVTDPRYGGSNPKVTNLINMVAHAKHEMLVVSDSDIRVRPDYLRQIVADLEEPEVGAVTCLYSGMPLGNIWAKLAAMAIDYHFLPNARLGIALRLTEPCFGSTIALRRSVLDEVGGFESLSNVLADDYELGRAIRERGYRLSIPDTLTVEHVCSQKSALALFRQELRWAKTNLLLAKSGYAGTFLTYPLPLALIAMLFLGFSGLTLAVAAGALMSRLYLVFQSGRALGLRGRHIWLLPFRDVLSFGVFVASFFGSTVVWKENKYIACPDGALAQL